ncbi:uncharacterized protein [Dermacentor albipictus]|uniref:uncharacterized protein isoform X2 n=1 Tax=Dermacentor albipictus TaxID=60249 RepID=UPI0038FC88BF
MFKPCRSRSACVESAERSGTSGTAIVELFSEEDDGAAGYAESSMGAPPIIEDPAVIEIFGEGNRDDRKYCGIMERRLKGKKSTSPKLPTVWRSNRGENTLAGVADSPQNSYMIRISGNGSNLSLARCEWASRCPPSADIENNGSQIRQRRSRARSPASQSKGRSVGKATRSGKGKTSGKGDGSKHRRGEKERRRRKVNAVAATLPPQELSPPSLSPPAHTHHWYPSMSACERHQQAAVANVAPFARTDQGDTGTTPTYKRVCHVITTTATPGEERAGDIAVPMAIGDGEHSPSKSRPRRPRSAKKVTEGSWGRRVDKSGDERPASPTVEITASEAAVMSEKEACSPLREPAPSTVTGFVFVDPSTPVKQFRYTETVQSGYGGAGQPWRPHPLCPVHSPQSGGGHIPHSANHLSHRSHSPPQLGPTLPAPTYYSANSYAAPWTWEQQQPQHFGELLYPPSGGSTVTEYQFYGGPVAEGAWYPAQQPPMVSWDGATAAGYSWSGGMVSNALPPFAAVQGAPPASQWSAPFEQLLLESHGHQGDGNLCHAQFPQSGLQRQLSPEGLGTSGSPSARTHDWLQIPSVLSDLGIGSKWGRTVTESFETIPKPQSVAKPTVRGSDAFFWSWQGAKPQRRRASTSATDVKAFIRRASMSGRHETGRRRSSVNVQEATDLRTRRRASVSAQRDMRRRSSASVQGAVKVLRTRRRGSLNGERDMRRRSSANVKEAGRSQWARRRSSAGSWKSLKGNRGSFSGNSMSERPHVHLSRDRASCSRPTATVDRNAKHRCGCSASARPNTNSLTRTPSINSCCCCCQETVPFHACCHGSCCGQMSRSWSMPCIPRVATSLQECHAHGAGLAKQLINNRRYTTQSGVPHACAMAARASCSHSPITVPVEVRITHQCSASPTLYPIPVPSLMTTAPLGGGPFQPQATEQKQSDEDMYLILPSKSGQDVVYHARHISPVLRLPSVQGVLETAGRQPYCGALTMPAASAVVSTWESEAQNAEAMKKKRDDRRRVLSSRKSWMKSTQAAGKALTANRSQKVSREPPKRASRASVVYSDKQDTEREEDLVEAGEQLTFVTKRKSAPSKRASVATEPDAMFKSALHSSVDADDLDKRSHKTSRRASRSSRKPSLATGRRFLDRSELGNLKGREDTSELGPTSRRASAVAGLRRKSAGQVEMESPDDSSARTERLGTGTLQVPLFELSSSDSPREEPHAAVEKTGKVSAEQASGLESQESTKEGTELTPAAEPPQQTGTGSSIDVRLTSRRPSDVILEERPEVEKRPLCTEINFALLVSIACIVWIIVIFTLTRRDEKTEYTELPAGAVALHFPTLSYTIPVELHHQTASTSTTELSPEISVCSSSICVQEGHRLREHMNREYSPCENFYRYVCETQRATPVLPSGGGAFSSVDTLLQEYLASVLRDYVLDENHRDVALVRALYSKCSRPAGDPLVDLQKEVFATLPIKRWPYKGNSLQSSDIWRMAGLLIRRFGVVTILEVSLGVKPGRTAAPTVELSYPRYLRTEDYSLGAVDTLRDAVLEAARELESSGDADSLVSQVMSVAATLATLAGNVTARQVLFTEYKDVTVNTRTFIESVFGNDLRSDIIVALREPRLLTDQLPALISTESVAAFMNYLGFRIIVSFAALFNSNRAASLRSVLSLELAGRILPAEMNWLLCMRAVERVQPACLGKALAMQQAAAGISATSRLWLIELEDSFYRHLPRVAWMTEQSLKTIGDKFERVRIERAVDAASWKLCTHRPLKTLDEGSSLRTFVRAAGEYQRERLRQIKKPSRPIDAGHVFDMHSRSCCAPSTISGWTSGCSL